MSQNRKDDLELKVVTKEHTQDSLDLLNYVFQVTNQDVSQIGESQMALWKKPIFEQSSILGWFSKNKLISQMVVYPFSVNIHGRAYKMGGVTGVGTYPEYAGLGLMNDLMKESLTLMREKGQTISYLFPYSIPYYRKKGWEIISDVITYTVRDTQIPKPYDVPGRIERVSFHDKDIRKAYEQFSKKENGAMIRNELAWDEHFKWERDDLIACVYYDAKEQPTGYMYYKVENETFFVQEMIFNNEEARRGLWNFIGAHFSMVYYVKGKIFANEPLSFFLEDGEIEEKISPYYMARIVDVEEFLRGFPFTSYAKQAIVLKVNDPMLEWNQDVFKLTFENGQKVERVSEDTPVDASLDIQTLVTLLLNYKRAKDLKEIGRIEATNATISYLEELIPDNQPWFSDYF
ncbi:MULTISPECIES: GNAT family N-acetyltransferase [Shouchella]|uniref:Acetyltransferase n=3 Tax=Bacillaceae TaxID=186817 RepID=A0A060LVN9_9BACI|nr:MULTISPECIES: GNAT family N-acetyltransferase [Bacillaceae]RQW20180.1 GNAT family N-acetyltransferase [Bacillus sp. C1-1]AIC94272.1 acetyltransferase [Shouchella lehensis G1]KQL57818.1 GNAT family acetyltransferase [Alkalicoccobacillus plakortidis]MBG9785882.1 GNAT family acetyltransferase [Shouchella lehensis]TES48352.1 GNAT family N-acetyltransferase [Shouchella lehensis]